jgi:hypothetical protein
MTYLRSMSLTTLIILLVIATLNLTVDPARIYRGSDIEPEQYAKNLFKSKIGIYLPADGVNERILAKSLIGSAPKVECAVIGSSHVMQISSARNPATLTDVCGSILNLGVSGAGIEDHLVMAYLTERQGIAKKIVFGVDPWTFAFNKDDRWTSYAEDFDLAKTEIYSTKKNIEIGVHFKDIRAEVTQLAKYKNLMNMEYTIRSMKTLAQYYRTGLPKIAEATGLDPAIGGPVPARLNDGSHVYSAKYIADSRKASIPIGGLPYKTEGVLNQKEAISLFRDALTWLRKKGIEPILVLTPYHQNVWSDPDSPNVIAMRQTERIVEQLAKEQGVKLYGSYNPKSSGCLPGEFYDFMHPDANCLARIDLH